MVYHHRDVDLLFACTGPTFADMPVADPFIVDTSELPAPSASPLRQALSGLIDEPLRDTETAMQAAREVIDYFEAWREKQRGWKPIKAHSRKAFAIAEFYRDKELPLPQRALRAIAHALGVFDYVDRRCRAGRAAVLEGKAAAERRAAENGCEAAAGRSISTAELARRVGISARTLRYQRTTEGYRARRDFIEQYWLKIISDRLYYTKAEINAISANYTQNAPREIDELPGDTGRRIIQMIRRSDRDKPIPQTARRLAYDLVGARAISRWPTPGHVMQSLAMALDLLPRSAT